MKRSKILRKICCSGLSFFLSLLLFVLLTLGSLWMGLFNRSMLLDQLKESNYYQKSYESFVDKVEQVLSDNGISRLEIEEIFPYAEFYVAERESMRRSLYQGRNESEGSFVKERIIELASQGEFPDELILRIGKLYEEETTLPFLKQMQGYISSFAKNSFIILGVILPLMAILVVILLFLHHYRHKGIRYVAYALLGACYMEIILGILVKFAKAPGVIAEGAYRDFLLLFKESSTMPFFYSAGAGILLFIVLVSVIRSMRKKLLSS